MEILGERTEDDDRRCADFFGWLLIGYDARPKARADAACEDFYTGTPEFRSFVILDNGIVQ